MADQPFPGGKVAAREDTVKLRGKRLSEGTGLTVHGELARLLELPGASESHGPSSFASASTNVL